MLIIAPNRTNTTQQRWEGAASSPLATSPIATAAHADATRRTTDDDDDDWTDASLLASQLLAAACACLRRRRVHAADWSHACQAPWWSRIRWAWVAHAATRTRCALPCLPFSHNASTSPHPAVGSFVPPQQPCGGQLITSRTPFSDFPSLARRTKLSGPCQHSVRGRLRAFFFCVAALALRACLRLCLLVGDAHGHS